MNWMGASGNDGQGNSEWIVTSPPLNITGFGTAPYTSA